MDSWFYVLSWQLFIFAFNNTLASFFEFRNIIILLNRRWDAHPPANNKLPPTIRHTNLTPMLKAYRNPANLANLPMTYKRMILKAESPPEV